MLMRRSRFKAFRLFRLSVADKQETEIVCIMSLSVFIGVHRWLKKAFDLSNQDLSVCASGGSL